MASGPDVLPRTAARDPPTVAFTADLDLLARWLDSAIRVPGTDLRLGLDALVGLIPGIGDFATTLASAYIVHRARQLGASRATLLRMAANVGLDAVVGAVPVLGDAFDVYWKANQKNVELLRRHVLAPPEQARRMKWADGLFVAALFAGLAAVVGASAAGAYYLISWLASAIGGAAG